MSAMQSILSYAMETAQKLGAQAVRASSSQIQTFDLGWHQQKIARMQSHHSSDLSLYLYVDGRYSSFSTSDLRKEALVSFIRQSIEMTRMFEPDECRGLADPEKYANRAEIDLELFDDKIADLKPEYHIEKCKTLENLGCSHTEIPIFDVSASSSHSIYTDMLATSNGFFGIERYSFYNQSLSLVLNDGDKKSSYGCNSSVHHLTDIVSEEELANKASKYASYKLHTKKLASGKRTAIMDRDVATYFLYKYLIPLSGMSLVNSQSYFLNKIGKKLGSDLFTLMDMPHIIRGSNSCLFDAEGMSTHDATIFENGVLKQYYLDTYSARKLKLEPTHGYNTNLVLKPGLRSLDAMIADVKDGIYIISFLGGSQDNTSGDFSFGISGVAIQDGKLTQNVAEMNITGNFLDIWNRLIEVGNDPRLDFALRIPSLRFDDVSFSGM